MLCVCINNVRVCGEGAVRAVCAESAVQCQQQKTGAPQRTALAWEAYMCNTYSTYLEGASDT